MNEFDGASSLPMTLYTAQQVKALDQWVMESTGLTSPQLMSRAAESALNVLLQKWPGTHRLCVAVGTGNNGGDGYLLAQQALAHKIAVRVLESGDLHKQGVDAIAAREKALEAGVVCEPFTVGMELGEARDIVVVDALLGTGLNAAPRESMADTIGWINDSGAPVLSLDIPSGLSCDTGMALGAVVHADVSVSFIGLKRGMFTGEGPQVCGQVIYRSLGVADVIAQFGAATDVAGRLDFKSLKSLLKPRTKTAHKGTCGSVLVIGGDTGFGGAAIMAAEAAARCGAGTVALLTRACNVSAALARRPEVMAVGVDALDESAQALVKHHVLRAGAIVIGPGLGREKWGHRLLSLVLRFAPKDVPLLLDADALNLLAEQRQELRELGGTRTLATLKKRSWVMTPHPGEAARLLGVTNAHINADRFRAAQQLCEQWGGVSVLKGAGSILCYQGDENRLHFDVCTEGNPGMASGGMGDVLSGIIGGLLAQGLSATQSARLGVCVHGEAADFAAEAQGERGMLATDLFPFLRRLMNDY